ncbi:MAG: CPBP family intramembrane glutamic endopeptidase [Bythopirellula sp.]|nr:CPBP family intramembrane glutamic endopeptidase [Bythopirellula sp.]
MDSETQLNRRRDWSAVIFALVLPTVVTLAYFVLAAKFPPAVQQATYGVAKTFQFLFPILFVVFVQRMRPQLWPWLTKGVLIGLLLGLAIGGLMLALYHWGLKSTVFFVVAAGEMRAKIAGMDLGSTTTFIAVGVFYSLIHSLLEEYYWRWFVFGQLRELTRLVPAMVISSLGFMAHHVLVIGTYFGFFSPWTWLFSFCVAIGGGVWAWLYNRSGSLLGPWLSHLLVDATIFLVGYEIAGPLLNK